LRLIVKRYFEVKKFLPSQKVIKKKNENLILSYTINNDEEIILLAKRWLPYMKILSPERVKVKFENLVKSFFDS